MQKQIDRGRVLVTALALVGLATAPIAAQQDMGRAAERTIRVSGVGEVRAQPDLAQIAFAVETTGATAQEAGRSNAQLMDRVVAALVAAGVPRADIETRGYSLHPTYAHNEGRAEPRITGYRASNQVLLRTTELSRSGEFIDTALGAGANRMDGISFELRQSGPAEAEALRNAVQRARASAEVIAATLGVRLGPILDASTSTQPIQPIPAGARVMRMEADMAAAPPTPVQPGEQTVRAHASLIFAIQD